MQAALAAVALVTPVQAVRLRFGLGYTERPRPRWTCRPTVRRPDAVRQARRTAGLLSAAVPPRNLG